MGTRNRKSTAQMMKWTTVSGTPWYRILRSRAAELANDEDHTFTYKDRDAVTKNYTRLQIVNMYETAYSELAESFHGHLEHIKELENDLSVALNDREFSHSHLLVANNRIAKLNRRIEGFLTVIEEDPID